MCYNAEAHTKAAIKYAQYRSNDPELIKQLQLKLDLLSYTPYYQISGFAHPNLLVFTNKEPMVPKLFHWGLIPSWCKDEVGAKKIINQTLNARGETIFEKPSFKNSAKSKRCLVYLDAFYEHHHIGKNTFPFRISMQEDGPMAVAGLWNEWANPMGSSEIVNTFTIVTTVGNPIMEKIHNNPKAEMGPRMPVILPRDKQDEWIDPNATQEQIEGLIKPCDESLLNYYTVNRINGKASIGNKPEITEPFKYAEVEWG